METKALIVLAALLAGCTTSDDTGKRVSAAAVTRGQAMAERPKLNLPEACFAHVERVPIRDEPWVIHNWRWNVSADNRDRQGDDCRAYQEDYNKQNAGNR